MEKSVLGTIFSLGTLALTSNYAWAEEPDNTISYNISVTSDYRSRGVSQSRNNPAIQSSVELLNDPTGLYAGVWASNILWVKDSQGSTNLEVDVYAGKRGNFTENFTYDIGLLGYIYPGNNLATNANTAEIYGQLGYGSASIKYYYSPTNFIAVPDSRGSHYFDFSVNPDLGKGFTFNFHVGSQLIANNNHLNYSDYKIGITKDFSGILTGSLAFISTDSPNIFVGRDNTIIDNNTFVLTLSKEF